MTGGVSKNYREKNDIIGLGKLLLLFFISVRENSRAFLFY